MGMDKTAFFTVMASIALAAFLLGGDATPADTPALNLKGTACYTNWWFKGNASDVWQSVINCPDPIGTVSVEQLYAKGWRVISVSRMNDKGAYYAVIVESQGR